MMTGGVIADDDSGLDIDNDVTEIDDIDPDKLSINLKVKSHSQLHRLHVLMINSFHIKLSELKVPVISSTQPTPRTGRSQLTTDARPSSVHDVEKSTPYPLCYANLLAGRTTGVSTSSTPGQSAQPGMTCHI